MAVVLNWLYINKIEFTLILNDMSEVIHTPHISPHTTEDKVTFNSGEGGFSYQQFDKRKVTNLCYSNILVYGSEVFQHHSSYTQNNISDKSLNEPKKHNEDTLSVV